MVKLPSITQIKDWLKTYAPIPLSLGAIGLVFILWRGGWPIETADARIQWLGVSLIIILVLLAIWLLVEGGVRNFSAKGGVVEISVNEGEKDE